MGQNNRQRRAAKQRRRAKERTHPPRASAAAGCDHDTSAAGAALLLLTRSLNASVRGGHPGLDLANFRRCAESHQEAAVDAHFTAATDALIGAGWTPQDLFEVARRKGAGPAVAHLLERVAAATENHPKHLIDPRWSAQLDGLAAKALSTGGGSPSRAWAQRAGLNWPAAFEQLLAVLVVVCPLPSIAAVLPPPGAASPHAASGANIDDRVLRRVRGLLAKAESTEHPDEADALTAKAQELMTRHSIERAVAESAQPAGSVPVPRRLWLENPYVDAKALLVEVVATANHCTAVQSALGFVVVVGHATDLDLVELLTTSLLVQATRAMTLAGSQVTRYGTSRTRSFRQSFLVAYASRIGERLRASAEATEATLDDDHAGALVPVLAARHRAVADTVTDLFPHLVQRSISASNPAGYGAGRAAADLAQFDVRAGIPGVGSATGG